MKTQIIPAPFHPQERIILHGDNLCKRQFAKYVTGTTKCHKSGKLLVLKQPIIPGNCMHCHEWLGEICQRNAVHTLINQKIFKRYETYDLLVRKISYPHLIAVQKICYLHHIVVQITNFPHHNVVWIRNFPHHNVVRIRNFPHQGDASI